MSEKNRNLLTLIECPRDAWQGINQFIPTGKKVAYLQALIDARFDTIDAGSFVSPTAVPQVSDTASLLEMLDLRGSNSKLLAIVVNLRGAEIALRQEKITYLGYPFSISETFQRKNANSSVSESLERLKDIQKLIDPTDKKLVVYISMGFGNPYGEKWNPDIVKSWVTALADLGINIFSLADTVGLARPSDIREIFTTLSSDLPWIITGAHFHSRPDKWLEKVAAAYDSGCRRFDGTISGFGGCPFAQDDLVGNIPTENLLWFADQKGCQTHLDPIAFESARTLFGDTISPYQFS